MNKDHLLKLLCSVYTQEISADEAFDELEDLIDRIKRLEEAKKTIDDLKLRVKRDFETILKFKAENEWLIKKIEQLYEGAEEQNDRIKRLEEAGDYLCAAAAFMGWHDKIETWNKAKEAKL